MASFQNNVPAMALETMIYRVCGRTVSIISGLRTLEDIVFATAVPSRMGPTNSAMDAQIRAFHGLMAREHIVAATTLPPSLKPLTKAKLNVSATDMWKKGSATFTPLHIEDAGG